MVLCLIGVPVAWMLKEQMDAAYALISLFIFFATLLTICLVFVPKVNIKAVIIESTDNRIHLCHES